MYIPYISHVLLKFIGKKEYAEDFLDGNFYMNTLYYFCNQKVFEEAEKEREACIKAYPRKNPDNITVKISGNLSDAQTDMLEGAVGYGSNPAFELIFGENMLSDCLYQAVGFQYCNILCFYRLNYRLDFIYGRNLLLRYDIPTMENFSKNFGEYVVIIKDKWELLRRISHAAGEMKFLCGDVQYTTLMRDRKTTNIGNRHHILVKQEPAINIRDVQSEVGDCFTKLDKYAWQNEWRLAIYRNIKDTSAFKFRVGDIRDIAHFTKTRKLIPELDKMLIAGDVRLSRGGYYGNITPSEMKEKFCELGDNKANAFGFVG